MCYSAMIAASARKAAAETGMPFEEALRLLIEEEKYGRWTTAFGRPKIPIILNDQTVKLARWTFLGSRIQDPISASKQTKWTAVARGEEMFSKELFRDAAAHRRVLIPVQAYYEHQHRGSVSIPFKFYRPNGERYFLCGIYQDGFDGPSVAVCTMKPNRLASYIHNNPEAHDGPRQPIVPRNEGEQRAWLAGGGPETIEQLLQVRDDGFLVVTQTEGSTGKWNANPPPPPPGMPEGVVVTGQLELL